MSSGAAVRRAGLLSGTVGAVAACTAALLLAPGALAAPYPPSQPCVITAAQASHRAYVPRPGVVDVDVHGAGASAGDLVSLGAAGRTLARVRADAQGGFTAVVTAPARPDGATPVVAAVTTTERCVSGPPPGSPGSPGDGDPTNGGSDGTDGSDGTSGTDGGGNGTAGAGGPGSTGPGPSSPATAPSGPLSTDIAGTTGSVAPSAPVTSAAPGSSSGNPTAGTGSTTAAPPRADVPRGSGPSLGIGLAIAAALLVLGTLAVLLLTRRPEH